jgi:hypothetical protein
VSTAFRMQCYNGALMN